VDCTNQAKLDRTVCFQTQISVVVNPAMRVVESPAEGCAVRT
jgi:hypothetical protein